MTKLKRSFALASFVCIIYLVLTYWKADVMRVVGEDGRSRNNMADVMRPLGEDGRRKTSISPIDKFLKAPEPARSSLYREAVKVVFGGLDPFLNLHRSQSTQNDVAMKVDRTFPHIAGAHLILEAIRARSGKFPSVVVEVGSYKGDSSILMAKTLKASRQYQQSPAIIICIDTWLGDLFFWKQKGDEWLLLGSDGQPKLYQQFLTNVAEAGHSDIILPLPATSNTGMQYLNHAATISPTLRPQFLFLDSSHEGNETLIELEHSLLLVGPGGYISGHDYTDTWPGVMKAVHIFVSRHLEDLAIANVSDWKKRPPGNQPWFNFIIAETPGTQKRLLHCKGHFLMQKKEK